MWNMIPTQGGTDSIIHGEGEKIVVKGTLIVESLGLNVTMKVGLHPYTSREDAIIVGEIEKLIKEWLEQRRKPSEKVINKEPKLLKNESVKAIDI